MIELIFFWLLVVVLFMAGFVMFFYRNPVRSIPSGDNMVSPADGKVIKIMKFSGGLKIKKGLFGEIHPLTKDVCKKGYLISIFMSPFDVHYNRAPMDGEILDVKHCSGKLRNAAGARAVIDNEKTEILMKTRIGKIKVILIAGLVARRIECFVEKGQKVKKGQLIGMIKLGSQVSMIIPNNLNIRINLKDRVKAGESVIGE